MTTLHYPAALLRRLLVHQQIEAIELGYDSAMFMRKGKSVRVDLNSASPSSRPYWLVLRAVTLTTLSGTCDIAGLPTGDGFQRGVWETQHRKTLLTSRSEQNDQICL